MFCQEKINNKQWGGVKATPKTKGNKMNGKRYFSENERKKMHYCEYPCGYKAKLNFYAILYDAFHFYLEENHVRNCKTDAQWNVLYSYLAFIEDKCERKEF